MKLVQMLICGFLLVTFFEGCTKDIKENQDNEFYTLNIEFEGTILKEAKKDIFLYETLGDRTKTYEGKIKRRGGFSISFPKHSYEIDLKQDVTIAELPSDDDWILNANFIDKTFLRHVISYDLFREMNINNISPKTNFVELELNNLYNGLYVLMEKLDKSSLFIDKKDSIAVIFKEPHIFRRTYDNVIPQNQNNFHQQTYPKIEESDKTSFIENVRDFIISSEDDQFTNRFEEVFDLQNIIDWHLLLLISNNSDGVLKNFYLYKIDLKTPLRISPWDYDHSFGRDGDNELNIDTRPMDITKSILFSRLLTFNWYKKLIKNKWIELNADNLLSVNGLDDRISTSEKNIAALVKRNFEKWPLTSKWYYDENNFEEEIQIMHQFVKLRHERLTIYFDSL